jgi:hypothetical protein
MGRSTSSSTTEVTSWSSILSIETLFPTLGAVVLIMLSVVVGLLIAAVLGSVSRDISEFLEAELEPIDAAHARTIATRQSRTARRLASSHILSRRDAAFVESSPRRRRAVEGGDDARRSHEPRTIGFVACAAAKGHAQYRSFRMSGSRPIGWQPQCE